MKETEAFLKRKGFGQEECGPVLEELAESGFLDDPRWGIRYARAGREKGRGRIRILEEMRRKGLSEETAGAALRALEEEEPRDEKEAALSAARKNLTGRPFGESELARAARRLSGQGYGGEVIGAVLEILRREAETENGDPFP